MLLPRVTSQRVHIAGLEQLDSHDGPRRKAGCSREGQRVHPELSNIDLSHGDYGKLLSLGFSSAAVVVVDQVVDFDNLFDALGVKARCPGACALQRDAWSELDRYSQITFTWYQSFQYWL